MWRKVLTVVIAVGAWQGAFGQSRRDGSVAANAALRPGGSRQRVAITAQATQISVTDALRRAGLVIRVGRRPWPEPFAEDGYDHTYLAIPRLDKDGHPVYYSDGGVVYDTFGVLGQWDDKKQEGTGDNQQVIKNDLHAKGKGFELRNDLKPGSDRNVLYEISVTPDQLAQLKAGAEYWSQWQTTGVKCPSCGKDYVAGIPRIDDGYNGNTWVYNMLTQNPAGRIEVPPDLNRAENKKWLPGWGRNDSAHDYYPLRRLLQP